MISVVLPICCQMIGTALLFMILFWLYKSLHLSYKINQQTRYVCKYVFNVQHLIGSNDYFVHIMLYIRNVKAADVKHIQR